MFEWILDNRNHGESKGLIIEFNKDNGKFVVDTSDSKEENLVEVDLKDLRITFTPLSFDNWDSHLYNKIINTNHLHFKTISMSTKDEWFSEIIRNEIIVQHAFAHSEMLTLVVYTLVINSQIVQTFTIDKKKESQRKFIEWFEELESSTNIYMDFQSISYEIDQISKEEDKFIYNSLS